MSSPRDSDSAQLLPVHPAFRVTFCISLHDDLFQGRADEYLCRNSRFAITKRHALWILIATASLAVIIAIVAAAAKKQSGESLPSDPLERAKALMDWHPLIDGYRLDG
mgnify:FL=1